MAASRNESRGRFVALSLYMYIYIYMWAYVSACICIYMWRRSSARSDMNSSLASMPKSTKTVDALPSILKKTTS